MPARWPFAKYHGLGNDFLVGPDSRGFDAGRAQRLCARHTGVGADGVMLVSSRRGRHAVRIFNADGSDAAFSGNGIRCAAAYLIAAGVASPLELATPAGFVRVERLKGVSMRLSFAIDALRRPGDPPVRSVALPAGLGKSFWRAFHVVLGNPHLILPVDDAERLEPGAAEALDRARGSSRRFPGGINVSLVAPISRDSFRMRTWERGVGLSPSCASGACAALLAGVTARFLPSAVRFVQDGGTVGVRTGDGQMSLEGPIELAFTGEA
ncbi:MAG: diaminopimelate epimerase [Candidatus Wallbacteria bacterium]|nr:diaminopimelate epimerase [Candidatus Wallbacteria bacterium]